MADLRKLKDRAADLAAKGRFEKAADAWREALEADPRDVATRQKLAEALRRAGRREEAVATYREVAERYARDGFLIKAIAVCKVILEIDPSHVETQADLAGLYARRSGVQVSQFSRPLAIPLEPELEPEVLSLAPEDMVEFPLPAPQGDRSSPPPVPVRPPPMPEAPPPPPAPLLTPVPLAEIVSGELLGVAATPYESILSAAAHAASAGAEEEIAIDGEPLETEPPAPEEPPRPDAPPAAPVQTSRIPIFSDLAPRAFVALTEGSVLRNVHAGEAILREGESGTSFFVVASGQFRVEKKNDQGDAVLLARLGEGAFFGEMALLSGTSRAAAVIADEDGQLLEISAELLRGLCREHPHVARSLTRFYRQRLLANAMATSPIFGPLDRANRKAVMERFRSREVRLGEVVVREGEPSDGLYVILSGAVDIRKRREVGEVIAGRLTEGDVFGEMSCLGKGPASATVVVSRAGTLLRLSREAFDEIVSAYPPVLEVVAQMSDERAQGLDAIVAGSVQFTTDGLVLV